MHKSQDLMCALAFVVDLNGNDNRDGTKTYIGIMKNKKEETRKKKRVFGVNRLQLSLALVSILNRGR